MLGVVIMQIPDSLASFWNVAGSYIINVVYLFVGAFVTYIFTLIHYRRKTWDEFKQRSLAEFYGPMLDLIKQVTAETKNSFEVIDASNQSWQEECKKHPLPFEDHNKYFEPYQKALDGENERLRKVVQSLDEMVQIFKSKGRLAYPSTEKLRPEFLQYVDHFHRQLPYEVWMKLDHSAKPLAKLHADVEAHFNNLKRKLSGDKRV